MLPPVAQTKECLIASGSCVARLKSDAIGLHGLLRMSGTINNMKRGATSAAPTLASDVRDASKGEADNAVNGAGSTHNKRDYSGFFSNTIGSSWAFELLGHSGHLNVVFF